MNIICFIILSVVQMSDFSVDEYNRIFCKNSTQFVIISN